jgi:hypothetical protein
MPFALDKFKVSEKSVVHEIQKPLGCLRILSEHCGLRLFVLFLMAAEVKVC